MHQEKRYYKISQPTIWNEGTGYFTINPKDLENFDRDFIVTYIDNITKESITKIISKEYIRDNIIPGKNSQYDQGYIKREYKSYAYRISKKSIIEYECNL